MIEENITCQITLRLISDRNMISHMKNRLMQHFLRSDKMKDSHGGARADIAVRLCFLGYSSALRTGMSALTGVR